MKAGTSTTTQASPLPRTIPNARPCSCLSKWPSIQGISVDELKRINNLSSNNLSVGQVIKVPIMNTMVYTVKSGDTLYSISKQYNIKPDQLMSFNNLTSNLLSVGQILRIPK